MLQDTPSLLHFSVDSNFSPFEHKKTVDINGILKARKGRRSRKTVDIKEFVKTRQGRKTFKGVQDVEDNGDAACSQLEYICLPALRTFSLKGSWTLDRLYAT